MKTTMAEDKIWFLASGTKKIGPLSEARVLERIADGKVSPRVKAWRDGMEEWTPLGSIPAFAASTSTLAAPAPAAPAAAAPAASASRPAGSGSSAGKPGRLVARKPLAAAPRAERFQQPFRIERADLWRAFEIGFELPRIKVALAAFGGLIGVAVFVAGSAWLNLILGGLAALLAGPLALGVTAIAMGALAYQTRRSVETGSTPPALEALDFARRNGLALVLSPILMSLLAVVPPVALLLKSLVSHIPTIGGPAAGITFGLDLALSAVALFLGVAASLAWQLVPSIVACEQEGPIGTVRALLGVVRSRIARILLWPGRPWAAMSALALLLVVLAAVVTVVPALLNATALGIDAAAFTKHGLKSVTAFEPGVGLVGIALWTAGLFAVVAAILVSTGNALQGLLYMACRPGNDDLITRDDWLARRQGELHASN